MDLRSSFAGGHACTRMKARSPRSAFTLVEVLFALVLFALAAVVLGASYVNVLNSYFAMQNSVRSEDDLKFARAALLAEPDREKAEEGASFESTDGRRVQWKCSIEPTNVADLFTVHFQCEINDRGELKAQRLEQRFRVLRPTWSEATDRDKLRADAKNRILELQAKKP